MAAEMSVKSCAMQSIEATRLMICAAGLDVDESQLPVYRAEKSEIKRP